MGRKKMTATEAKVDIRIRVDADMFREFKAAADEEGNSVAAFLRSAGIKELKRRKKESDA